MNKTQTKRGFTLVEIMIVVAILGLLIAIGVPGFLKARNKGRFATESANLKAISDNIAAYSVNEGVNPTDITVLWPSDSTTVDANSYIRRQLFCPINSSNYTFNATGTLGSCESHGDIIDESSVGG